MQGNRKMIINLNEEEDEFSPSLLDMDKFRKEISPPPSLRSFNYSNEANLIQNKKKSKQNNKLTGRKRQNNKNKKKENSILNNFYFLEKIRNILNVKCVTCHQCKKVNYEKNVLTCKRFSCGESFCEKCIKSYVSKICFREIILKY